MVEELSAKLQIELVVKLGDPFPDFFGLQSQVLAVVETDLVHVLPLPAAFTAV